MSFDPDIQVLSEQPAELAPADTSWPALLRRFPGLDEAQAVVLTGSRVAGWGNAFSDIDIYAFSDTSLSLPSDTTMETWTSSHPNGLRWQNWMGRYGDARVDIQVWPTDSVTKALGKCGTGDPEMYPITGAMPNFLYRLSIGAALKGEDIVRSMKRQIENSTYRFALARSLKGNAENSLTDVAGQLAADDGTTARLSARVAADHVVDMCLVLAGDYCRRQKWLYRRLQATPSCGVGADEYRSMVMEGARPGESDGDCARRVARWAQTHLVRVEEKALTRAS